MSWKPIKDFPYDKWYLHFLLCHKENKWIRFGKWFPQQKEWYYSGTNERSQWAQVKGDEPTHWMDMPDFPEGE